METTEQGAPQPSVDDRIDSIFNGGAPAAEQTAEAQTQQPQGEPEGTPEPETFEMDYDGEKFIVPKKLEKAFLQERDYTQKAQELAENRRLVEVQEQQLRLAGMQNQFQASVSKEVRDLGLFDAAIAEAQRQDWANMSTDDIIRKRLEIDQWKEQREGISKSLQSKYGEFQQTVQSEMERLKAASQETLKKRIPTWSESLHKEVFESAAKDGYTKQELDSIIDPRHHMTLWKAHMYDVSQKKASEAVRTVQSASVQARSSKPMDAKTKDMLNYRKQIGALKPGSQERLRMAENRAAKLFGG
jgi:hypothetical protein